MPTRPGPPPAGLRERAGRRLPAALSALLAGAGVAHLVFPAPFESIVPRALGPARPWVLGSGVAELACAALVALPGTRRLGGRCSAVLFVAVFPANLTMAWDARHHSALAFGVSLLRLPLQVPLVLGALRVARAATPTPGNRVG